MRLDPCLASLCLVATMLVACGDEAVRADEPEFITTVTLAFTPAGGGTAVTASFDDPDGDGGDPPVVDPIDLVAGTTYTATVAFLNKLEEPPEDITLEIVDESDEHQLFFTGTAVTGPASDRPGAPLTHTYADSDANGLPIGLANMFAAATGTGELTVTLRHLPPLNDTPTKSAELAAEVQAGGFSVIGGETDAPVSFTVTGQ
jgi:hypothetical protein